MVNSNISRWCRVGVFKCVSCGCGWVCACRCQNGWMRSQCCGWCGGYSCAPHRIRANAVERLNDDVLVASRPAGSSWNLVTTVFHQPTNFASRLRLHNRINHTSNGTPPRHPYMMMILRLFVRNSLHSGLILITTLQSYEFIVLVYSAKSRWYSRSVFVCTCSGRALTRTHYVTIGRFLSWRHIPPALGTGSDYNCGVLLAERGHGPRSLPNPY